MRWISEEDRGMYDAIYKGFNKATGDIYAWLNSDDMYMPWACEIIATVMSKGKVRWCTGIPCHYSEGGVAHNIPRITPVFSKKYIVKGYMDGRISTFLEQESMFWTRGLWEKCGHVIQKYHMAGDYHLWIEFAKHEKLYTLDSLISGFRIHAGQKSEDRVQYYAEVGKLSFKGRLLEKTKIIVIMNLLFALTDRSTRICTRHYFIEDKKI